MGKRRTEEQEQSVETSGFVTLNSSVTVRVYPGIIYENASNNDTRIGDRLKVIEKWSKYGVLIKTGVNELAAEIAEWPTVKELIAKRKMTVVGKSDTAQTSAGSETKELVEEVKDVKSSLEELSE